jgi:hypothetical protein
LLYKTKQAGKFQKSKHLAPSNNLPNRKLGKHDSVNGISLFSGNSNAHQNLQYYAKWESPTVGQLAGLISTELAANALHVLPKPLAIKQKYYCALKESYTQFHNCTVTTMPENQVLLVFIFSLFHLNFTKSSWYFRLCGMMTCSCLLLLQVKFICLFYCDLYHINACQTILEIFGNSVFLGSVLCIYWILMPNGM